MINFLKRLTSLLSVASAAALVTACGGGGSPSTTVVPVAGPAQLMAQYEGTWAGVCRAWEPAPSTRAGSYRDTVKFGAPAADGSVSTAVSEQFFSSRDCTGPVAANIIEPIETTVPMGTTTVGAVPVVKIEQRTVGGAVTFTGPAATLGTCGGGTAPYITVMLGAGSNLPTVCIETTRAAGSFKQILSLVTPLNTFDTGVVPTGPNGILDAQSYPNILEPASEGRYTKQ